MKRKFKIGELVKQKGYIDGNFYFIIDYHPIYKNDCYLFCLKTCNKFRWAERDMFKFLFL